MRTSKLWMGAAALGLGLGASHARACIAPDSCSPCAPADVALNSIKLDLSAGQKGEGEAVSIAPALAGLGGGEAVVTVHVFSNDFSTTFPGPVTDPVISVGDTVHWVFDDAFHTVTSIAGSAEVFDSGFVSTPGETFDHTFTQVGTFPYICTLHGFDAGGGQTIGMAGVITVRPVPEPASAIALLLPMALRRPRRA